MIGKRVRVWKWVLDKDYSMEGTVKEVKYEPFRVTTKVEDDSGNTDWYEVSNDLLNKFEVLGEDGYTPCHYCGQPSDDFGFFGEAVCSECKR